MTTATTVDRSEFRHILFSGTIVGLVTSAAVIAFLVVSRLLPAGIVAALLGTLIVLAAGVSAAFLPAFFATSRTTQGIASAAAIGLWGTIVFMAVDIVVLRPLHAFPWTWDAIGGGSTWWYLPIWWMPGTFLAWMGGIVTAASGEATLARRALPAVAGTIIVTAIGRLAGVPVASPVVTGAAFTLVLAALALVALARKG